MPRNKYVHVYIQEVVEPIAETNLETGIEQNISTRIDDETDQNIETGIIDVEIGKVIPCFNVGFTVENEDDESDSKDSDSLHSVNDSITDDKRRRYPEFNSKVDLENPQFRKGFVFADKKIIKAVVREYGVRNRYNVRLKVNDSKRLQAVCKDGCPWMLWASRVSPKDCTNTSWQIKTYVGEHDYIRDVKNRNCTYKWVAKAYVDKFRVEPTYSTKSLRQDVATDHILQVPSSKCSRTKKLALEMIQGSHDEQYSRVYDYFAELRGCNPGTTTILQLDDRVFERMYICLQACKDGFKACRPIICRNDMELTNSNHYKFMSDKQKGLVYAIIDVFPYAEHRTCVRHLYSNFKLKNDNQGKALKDVLWKAARVTYMKEFTDAMSKMRSMSDASFKWLQGKDPRQWSKSHFSTRCWPRAAGANNYEVSAGPIDQHVVNLENHSYSCRKRDLTSQREELLHDGLAGVIPLKNIA
ncbi:hypothetical protein V6N13_065654 [Hibiscus sabdariffa]